MEWEGAESASLRLRSVLEDGAHRLLDRCVAPTLIIGVKLGPFEAHAWVQHGASVVNDVRNNGPQLLDPAPADQLTGVVDPDTGEVL